MEAVFSGAGGGERAVPATTFREAIAVGLMRGGGCCNYDALAVIERAAFFRGCAAEELEELARTAQPVSFRPGEMLCLEGTLALACYVIAEGEASVTTEGRELARVGEEDVVGERGPLEGCARTATVVATTPVFTYAITRQRLLSLARRSPAAAFGMYEYLRRRYAEYGGLVYLKIEL
jgi:CRP-like cAMP-binding protein